MCMTISATENDIWKGTLSERVSARYSCGEWVGEWRGNLSENEAGICGAAPFSFSLRALMCPPPSSLRAAKTAPRAQLGFRLEQPYLCCLLIATWKRLNSIFRTLSRMTCMIRNAGTHDIDITPRPKNIFVKFDFLLVLRSNF